MTQQEKREARRDKLEVVYREAEAEASEWHALADMAEKLAAKARSAAVAAHRVNLSY